MNKSTNQLLSEAESMKGLADEIRKSFETLKQHPTNLDYYGEHLANMSQGLDGLLRWAAEQNEDTVNQRTKEKKRP